MRTGIYLGVDMGSTGLKAVAFEAGSGVPLAASGGPLPFTRLPSGGCELNGQAIEKALARALREVSAQLGRRALEVRALGCTGHGAGLYALDAHGQLLRGCAVASTDQRASGRARALDGRAGDALFEEVGCRPWSGQPTLIAAELFASQALRQGEVRHLLFAKDYLCFLLSGQMATEASDVSTAGLLSLPSGSWSKAAIEAAGLPEDVFGELPPIVPSGTVVGRLAGRWARDSGLPAGLPIVTGAIDLLASLVAVGAHERGQAVAVLGTWCVNAVIAPPLEPKPTVGGIVSFGPADRRLYLENSPSSMANVAWLAATLGFTSAAEVVDCAMSVPLGAAGLRFLPFINGGSSPPGASAGFIGLKSNHDRSHMARAVVDAVAALHARHLKRLASLGLSTPGLVAALGGGARDARLVRLLASLLGHPVNRCGDDETGARGAALYAALSQGDTGDGGASPLPAVCEPVVPAEQDLQAHADFYAEFNGLIDSLVPAFAHMAEGAR